MVVGPNKRRNKNKWGLPQNLNPEGTTPLCVNVPDDPQWIAKFYGAIFNLSIERNWDWNETEDRIGVSARWLEVYQDLLNGGCDDIMNCDELLACLNGTNTMRRMNPTTGRVEVSNDGGATWSVDETHDPRFSAPRVEMAAGDCAVVNNIVGAIQYYVERQVLDIAAGAGAVGVAATAGGFLSLLFSITPWSVVGIALAAALAGFTSAAIEAAMTLEVWNRLLCNIYCALDGADEITTSHFDAILTRLGTDETGIAYTVLWHTINSMGPVGLQNSVQLGLDGGFSDCDGCDCDPNFCYVFDFSGSQQHSWTLTQGSLSSIGLKSAVLGNGHRDLETTRDFDDAVITRVVLEYRTDCEAFGGFRRFQIFNNGVSQYSANLASGSSLNHVFDTGVINVTGDQLYVSLDTGAACGDNYLKRVTVYGVDPTPFGEDNC